MKTLMLVALFAAGCGAGTDASFTARSTESQAAPGTCTFKRQAACGSTDCCEFDSTTYPGYREEYVCCGGTGKFVMRICSCPGCQTPCGEAGPNGCAICALTTYSVSCNVHPQEQDGEPHSCGYVLDADD